MMILHTLPFSEPCDGCDGHTEAMTKAPASHLYLHLDDAMPGDRVYCTRCDCTGTIEITLVMGKYVDWGVDICDACQAVLSQRLEALTQHIREALGCDSVVITREE